MPLTNLDLFRLGAFEACVQFLTGAQLADMEEKKEGESKLEGLANVLKWNQISLKMATRSEKVELKPDSGVWWSARAHRHSCPRLWYKVGDTQHWMLQTQLFESYKIIDTPPPHQASHLVQRAWWYESAIHRATHRPDQPPGKYVKTPKWGTH